MRCPSRTADACRVHESLVQVQHHDQACASDGGGERWWWVLPLLLLVVVVLMVVFLDGEGAHGDGAADRVSE